MQKKRRVIVTVSNDLATDQRVLKVCRTLCSLGYKPHLVGRLLPASIDLPELPFGCTRMKLFFKQGALFYAELNIRLFIFLLFRNTDRIHANDLDTLLPCWLVAGIKRVPLVYDTHEYFTGVPEIQKRKLVKNTWRAIEGLIFPRLKRVITVNDSIASLYEADYNVRPVVMRNIPAKQENTPVPHNRSNLQLNDNEFVMILQGAGINVDRGAEEAVMMMQYLEHARLIIAGSGDVVDQLKTLAIDLGVAEKVIFMPRMKYSDLIRVTAACDLGLTLDKDTNINYRFSLPNKLFDYIHAGIPVFASNLPEVARIIHEYGVGRIAENHDPRVMAGQVKELMNNQEEMWRMKTACTEARNKLTWQQESTVLQQFYPQLDRAGE